MSFSLKRLLTSDKNLQFLQDNSLAAMNQLNASIPVYTAWAPIVITWSNLNGPFNSEFFFKRIGDTMYLKGSVYFPGGPTGPLITFSLPSQYQVDPSKLEGSVGGYQNQTSYTRVGSCSAYSSSTGFEYVGAVTNFRNLPGTFDMSGPNNGGWDSTIPLTWTNPADNEIHIYGMAIPILGWS